MHLAEHIKAGKIALSMVMEVIYGKQGIKWRKLWKTRKGRARV